MSQAKPGDLAVVVEPKDSMVLGWFVRVREQWNGGPIDGEPWTGDALALPGLWLTIELPHAIKLQSEQGELINVRAIPYLARWLQPIRGVPVTEEQHEEIRA